MVDNTPQRQDQPESGEEGSQIPRFATQDLLLRCQRCREIARRTGLFQCLIEDSCRAVFPEKECMIAHMKLSHPGASMPCKPGPSTIVCVSAGCQQKFTCEAAYLAHLDSVHGLHKFFCAGCHLIIQADRKSKDPYKQKVKGSGRGKFRKASDLTRSEKRRASKRLVKHFAPKTLFKSEGETEDDDTDEEEEEDEEEEQQKKEDPGKSKTKKVLDYVGLTNLFGKMRRKRTHSSSGPDSTSSSKNTLDIIPPDNQSPLKDTMNTIPVGGYRAAEFLIQNQDKLAPPQKPPVTSPAGPTSGLSAAELIDRAQSQALKVTPTKSSPARSSRSTPGKAEQARSIPMVLTPTQSPVSHRAAAASAEPNRPAENPPMLLTMTQSPITLRRAAAAAAAEPNRPAPEPPVGRPASADRRPLEAYPHPGSITYVLIEDHLFPLSPRSSAYYGLDTRSGHTPADKSGAVQRYAESQRRAQLGESRLRDLLLGVDDAAATTGRRSAIQTPSPAQGQAVGLKISPDSAIETTPPVVSSTTSPEIDSTPGNQGLPARRRGYQLSSPTELTPDTSPEITQKSSLENLMKMVDKIPLPGQSVLKKVKSSPGTSPNFNRRPTLPRPQRRAQEPRRTQEQAYEDTPEYKEEQRLKSMTPEELRQAFLEKVEVEKRKLQENAGRKANIFDVFGAIKNAASTVPGGESVLPASILEEHILRGGSDHTGTSSGRSEEEEERFFIEHSRKKLDRSMSGGISAPQYSSKSPKEDAPPARRDSPANLCDFADITPAIPNPYQLPDTPDGSAKASSDEHSSEESAAARPPRNRGPEIRERVSSLPPKMRANPEILKKIDELMEEKKRLLEEFNRREDALDISQMLPRNDYRPPDSMPLGKYYNPRDPKNPKWPEFKIPMSKRERQLRSLDGDEQSQEEEEPAQDEGFDVSIIEYDPKTLKYAHYKDHKRPEYPIDDEVTVEKRKEHKNKVFGDALKKVLRKVSNINIKRNQEKGVSKIGQLSPKSRKAVIDLSQNVFVREEDIQVSVENCEKMKLKNLVKLTVRDVLHLSRHSLVLQESNYPRGDSEWVDNVFDNGETATARRDEHREKPKGSKKEKARKASRRSASESAAADSSRGGLAQENILGASAGTRPQETRQESSWNIPWISTGARSKEPREQSSLKKPMDKPRASSSTDDSSGELPKKQMKMRHASVPSSFPLYESFEGERFIPCKKILIRDAKRGQKVKYMFHVYKSETNLNDSESDDSKTDTADENGQDEPKKNI
ncbi:hypothetical protein TKK_0014312 [Trichogramma kaykai]|uniref:C2H2-type domain-containing protein n=1 Tax=Trichogramma kaykai TaxID=54128 RepID=A0ABD2WDS5_9HYME